MSIRDDITIEEQKILAEVELNGRFTERQEDLLYNITLRQDELGRTATNMLLEDVIDSPIYQPMIDRKYLTYEVFDKGQSEDAPQICSLYVTLTGVRYCIMFGDEIALRRKVNPAGAPRK